VQDVAFSMYPGSPFCETQKFTASSGLNANQQADWPVKLVTFPREQCLLNTVLLAEMSPDYPRSSAGIPHLYNQASQKFLCTASGASWAHYWNSGDPGSLIPGAVPSYWSSQTSRPGSELPKLCLSGNKTTTFSLPGGIAINGGCVAIGLNSYKLDKYGCAPSQCDWEGCEQVTIGVNSTPRGAVSSLWLLSAVVTLVMFLSEHSNL